MDNHVQFRSPFEHVTAEKLSSKEAVDLWSDSDTRFARVSLNESCFINGLRGTGKTMLFRILQYDCQRVKCNTPTFLSVYLPIRDTELTVAELATDKQNSNQFLVDCHLSAVMVKELIKTIQKFPEILNTSNQKEFIDQVELLLIQASAFSTRGSFSKISDLSFHQAMQSCIAFIDQQKMLLQISVYKHGLQKNNTLLSAYEGAVITFESVFAPICEVFTRLTGLPIYVLVDDADELPIGYCVQLNSWIARRKDSISFKVSTMFGYKTFETLNGAAIQAPHDFTEFEIATRFLYKEESNYIELLRDICTKRLKMAGISNTSPDEFFPRDSAQLKEIAQIQKDLELKYRSIYSEQEAKDYAYRHAASEYLKKLNKKHSSVHYKYCGFETLAIISGGQIREFLIWAQRMFDYQAHSMSKNQRAVVKIEPRIQNKVIREFSQQLLTGIKSVIQKKTRTDSDQDWTSVFHMITFIGTLFRARLLSDHAERRVFSFALSGKPSPNLSKLLKLAQQEGYLVCGIVSLKNAYGKRELYVLSRRLAPAFGLDPVAYNGYLSVRPEVLEQSSNRIRRVRQNTNDQLELEFKDDLFYDEVHPSYF